MFVALVIRHAKRMRCTVLSSVASLAVPRFCTLSHKRHDFRGAGGGGTTEKKMYVVFFSTVLSEIFLIPRRIQRGMMINVDMSSCKVPVVLVRF